jgi:putative aldouronate transport system substrate-binding protein
MFWGLSFLGGMKGNHPEAAARVINFLISPDGYKLTAVGVEGVDFKVENDEIAMLPQRNQDGFPTESGDTGAHPLATGVVSWVPQEWQDWALLYGKDQAFKDWYKSMWANQGKYQIETYGTLTTTPLWTTFQQTSSELITRSFLDAVKAGSEQETAGIFDQFVKDWLAAGGEAAQAEMSENLVKIYG